MSLSPKRSLLAAALAAASMLALLTPSALAATDIEFNGSTFTSEIRITDLTDDADAIAISVAGNTITIVDTGTGGITTADPDCEAVNPETVTCPLDPPDPAVAQVGQVRLRMRDGTDRFTNQNLAVEVIEDDSGKAGSKTVNSGPGRDVISTGTGDDVVNLGNGNDIFIGDEGADAVVGGQGADFLLPEEGADIAEGGPGDDGLSAEPGFNDGADRLDGGPGSDEVRYLGNVGVTMAINGLPDDGHPGEGDNLTGFELLVGTEGVDRLVANAANDLLAGLGGDDTLIAGGGDDELIPGEGDDLAEGGEGSDTFEGEESIESGADRLDGGPGGDFLDYDGGEAISFSANGIADDGRVGEGDNAVGIEGAEGTGTADTFLGNGSSNRFLGLGGDDTMTGGGGNDALSGGDGDDTLLSRGGRDDVECGLGFDTAIHDADDVLSAGCERRGAEVASDGAVANRRGQAKIRVSCPAEEGAACKGKVALISNGKRIGSGKFSVGAGRTKAAKVRLTRKGRRALARSKGSLRLSAEAHTVEPQGTSINAAPLELDAKARRGKRRA
jgi:Ca2+-binding RTX toxin-like protein